MHFIHRTGIPSATTYSTEPLKLEKEILKKYKVDTEVPENSYHLIAYVLGGFPWPHPTPEQKARIEQTAKGIHDTRVVSQFYFGRFV